MMNRISKRIAGAAVALIAVMLAAMMTLVCVSQPVYADEVEVDINCDGFQIRLWVDTETGMADSIQLRGYTGTETVIKLPTHLLYNGVEYPIDQLAASQWQTEDGAFKGNPNITKVIIPSTYSVIGKEAFANCPNLAEVVIAENPNGVYLDNNIFGGCQSLKTYVLGWTETGTYKWYDPAIGQDMIDSSGTGVTTVFPDVTVYGNEKNGEENTWIYNYITDVNNRSAQQTPPGNTIAFNPLDGKDQEAVYKYVVTAGELPPAKSVEPGQPVEAVDKFIQNYASEKDPKGSKFGLLQAKVSKVGKNYLKVSWKKISGCKYIVYGNKCGKKNKFKKIKTVSTTSFTQKKLKKGTYYKYLIVAVKNGKTVSTSKNVHATTTGGKYGNNNKVTTKAKKNKVTLKKGKSFKLGAKAKTASKKIKVNIHRSVAYESSNTKIATVSSKGVIKAKKKGKCYVYAYAQNGVRAKVAITVK